MASASGRPTWRGFLKRWFLAVLLVSATYNSSPVNYVTWVFTGDSPLALKLIATLLMLIAYAVYLRATFVSIGWFGIAFIAALFFGVYWLLLDYAGNVVLNPEFVEASIIVAISTIMAVGLYWSFIRRIVSGQFDGAG